MKRNIFILLLFISQASMASIKLFEADNKHIRYTGRIDFSDVRKPRFWAAGVYISAAFEGTSIDILINDQEMGGKNHNYLEVVLDDKVPFKIQTTGALNSIVIAHDLAPGRHTITIVKNTEALIGYLEFVGFRCESLVALPAAPKRKMEFIGDSITSGMGMDNVSIPCNTKEWYDQHNAYMSYGPLSARKLNAQWQLTSESGIGLIHSCCNKKHTMPELYDKISISADSLLWDFGKYQPDVVTVCLGQNDGKQDSIQFCSAYVTLLANLRKKYPRAMLVSLTSPMASGKLQDQMKRYVRGIVEHVQKAGDMNTSYYFFSRNFNKGCGGHPDMEDHQHIAEELSLFISEKMNWRL